MTRITSSWRQTRLTVFVATLSLVVLTGPDMSQAQTTDITPSGFNTTVGAPTPLPNGMINHDITGGSRPGNGPNLFHSFGEFSVGTNHIANFLNETATPTTNILSRVTGGHESDIYGTIQTNGTGGFGTANLYLINPAGVIFGPTASINVGGSFAASTADYLKLADGLKFNAIPGPADALWSMAPVAAFGFLGANPGGTISIQGGAFSGTPSITLVGRDLKIGNTTTPGIVAVNVNPAIPFMSGNVVNLISVGQLADPVVGGEVNIAANFTFSGFGTSPGGNILISSGQISTTGGFTAVTPPTGTVTIAPSGSVNNTVGTVAGSPPIDIVTGNFLLDGFLLTAGLGNITNSPPGPVTVTAAESITLNGGNCQCFLGSIETQANAASPGAGQISGGITFTSPSVTLTQGGALTSDVVGPGFAGAITLNVENLSLIGEQNRITSNWDGGNVNVGRAGNITIRGLGGPNSSATSVDIAGPRSGIFATTRGAAPGGSILVNAQSLSLASETEISSSTFSTGNAGNVILNVGTLTAAGHSAISSNSSSNDSTAGNAGSIVIQGLTGSGNPAASVSLDNSTISTTIAGGTSSSIPATIDITAQTVNLTNGIISTVTNGAASAGSIAVKASTITMNNNSFIESETKSHSFGNAGAISIKPLVATLDLRLNNNAKISSSSDVPDPTITAGNGGSIDIIASSISLTGNTIITSNTNNSGNAGNISITATNDITVKGTSRISNETISAGQAGSLHIKANSLILDGTGNTFGNEGDLASQATGIVSDSARFVDPASGNAGKITVDATNISVLGGAKIASRSLGSTGNAGSIKITATDSFSLSGTQLLGGSNPLIRPSSISTDSGPASLLYPAQGAGGDITIQAGTLSINKGAMVSTTIAGGTSSFVPADIKIAAQAVTLSNGGAITASTTGNAPAGNIGLVTQQLTMAPDSVISSNAREGGGTIGRAGSITITGAGTAPTIIAGGTIQAQSETSAIAGDITLQAPGDLSLFGTTVSVKNTGPGNAGSIGLLSGNDLLVRNSQVSTESANASGGDITLTAPHLIRLVDSKLSSSVEADSKGGNITIDPQLVVIQNSQILANATAGAGAGGIIFIEASGAVLVDPNSTIEAKAGPAGVNGIVSINAPIQVLSGALVPLNLVYSQAGLSGDRCAADPKGQFSSFVQTGRDGVPQVPGALSPSPLSFLDTLTSGSLELPMPNLAAARLGLNSVSYDDSTLFRFHSACRS